MGDPRVERYEAILKANPASPTFVELGKIFCEAGDWDSAAATLTAGLSHHPSSVVGRVLLGKALLKLKRTADAMAQFDKATKTQAQGLLAYHLVVDVLLRERLYRSALPVLKKAVAQGRDERLSTYLQETDAALKGGPAPKLPATVLQEFRSSEEVPSDPESTDAHESLGGAVDAPTQMVAIPSEETPAPAAVAPKTGAKKSSSRAEKARTIRGLTETFDALAAEKEESAPAAEEDPFAAFGPPSSEQPIPVLKAPAAQAPYVKAPVTQAPTRQAALAPEVAPAPPPTLAPVAAVPAPTPSAPGLLDDIPDLAEGAGTLAAKKANQPPVSAVDSSREYEKELSNRIAQARDRTHSLKRYRTAALFGLLFLALTAGAASFWGTRAKHGGLDFASALAQAKVQVAFDTRESYQRAVELLLIARDMDGKNVEAAAWDAYARALLAGDYGVGDHAALARDALSLPLVRERFPQLALVADTYLADEGARAQARKAALESKIEAVEVHTLAGRLLFAERDFAGALKRFKNAHEMQPGFVRPLVGLGDCYLAFNDDQNAAQMFEAVRKIADKHPLALLGLAEVRLRQGEDASDLAADIAALTPASLEAKDQRRLAVTQALMESATGQHDQAIDRLARAAKAYGDKAFDVAMAQGRVLRAAGRMGEAEAVLRTAVGLNPKNADAREALGRVLLDRGREKELLKVIEADSQARGVSLVRAIALVRTKEFKKAREELEHTAVKADRPGAKKQFPVEAVVYLALADAGEDQPGRAVEVLEPALAKLKRNKAVVQVALARVYKQQGALDKAKALLEQAAKDPTDFEGSAQLGDILFGLGLPQTAVEPLQKAFERNGSHTSAFGLLVRSLILLGRNEEAFAAAERWVRENADLPEGLTDVTWARLANGRFKEAEEAAAEAVKKVPPDPRLFRAQAQALFARADAKGAFAALERANKLNAKDAETFCAIGEAFVRQSSGDLAMKAYEAALRENAKSSCALVGIFHARPTKAALKDLPEWFKREKNAPLKAQALAAMSRAAAANGMFTEAEQFAQEAIELSPHAPYGYFAKGVVEMKKKNDEVAAEAFGKAVLKDASWAAARLYQADLLAKGEGKALASAVEAYQAVLVLSQDEGEVARVRKLLPALQKRAAAATP